MAKNKEILFLKNTIQGLSEKKKYAESLPYLQRYRKLQPHDVEFQILYAQNLLFRSIPNSKTSRQDQDIYCDQKKNYLEKVSPTDTRQCQRKKTLSIRRHYRLAARIFAKYVPFLEKQWIANPNKQKKQPMQKLANYKMRLAKLYFQFGFAETYAGNPYKAIRAFLKSSKFAPERKESYYNIASLYEILGKKPEAKVYWLKYEKIISKKQDSK
ncbi:MAG: hypothetical protein AAF518_16805 [Spirochaetota bacterium]